MPEVILTEEQYADIEKRLTDGENTIAELHTRLGDADKAVKSAYYEALGWTVAYACFAVNQGVDIRKVEAPIIIAQMEKQLLQEKDDG